MTTKEEEQKLSREAMKCGVPDHLIDGLVRYIVHGIPTGSFLRAVLSNDLMESFGQADEHSAAGIRQLCTFLYSYAPAACKGSPEAVKTWIIRLGATRGGA